MPHHDELEEGKCSRRPELPCTAKPQTVDDFRIFSSNRLGRFLSLQDRQLQGRANLSWMTRIGVKIT